MPKSRGKSISTVFDLYQTMEPILKFLGQKPFLRNSDYGLGLDCAKSKEGLEEGGVPQTSQFTRWKSKSTQAIR